jgi:hypothetical protein
VDPFRFAITLPTDADSLPLLGTVCDHVAEAVGLGERAARQAKEELEQAVRERMRASDSGAVEVAFEQKAGEETVVVEVTSGRPAGGAKTLVGPPAGGSGGGTASQRFVWDARRSG